MKKTKKYASAMLAIWMIVVTCVIPVCADATVGEENRLRNIEALIDEKQKAYEEDDYEEVERINRELEQIGAELLTAEEVEEKMRNSVGANFRIAVPTGDNKIDWTSTRANYSYKGESYEVQYLFASPKSALSNLHKKGDAYIKLSKNEVYDAGEAGANILKVVATDVAGAIIGSTAIGILEYVDAALSGFNFSPNDVEISEGDTITYKYAMRTTVKMCFVKRTGESDNLQTLAFLATKGTTDIICSYIWSTDNDDIPFSESYELSVNAPLYSASGLHAVKCYLNENSSTRSYVKKFTVSGLGRTGYEPCVFTLYPLCPDGLAHIVQ